MIGILIPIKEPARVTTRLHSSGTTAILRSPPDIFPSGFGPGALALHKAEAARVGAQCLIINNQRIAVDIDEPKELQVFLTVGQNTARSIQESRSFRNAALHAEQL